MVGFRSEGNVDLLRLFLLLVASVTIDTKEAISNVLLKVKVNI